MKRDDRLIGSAARRDRLAPLAAAANRLRRALRGRHVARTAAPRYVEPAGRGGFNICVHCWGVNPVAGRLCGRCGADMSLALQESGGLRRTAPVQSPVPVPGGPRLSLAQRVLLFWFLALLILSQVFGAVYATAAGPAAARAGSGVAPAGAVD